MPTYGLDISYQELCGIFRELPMRRRSTTTTLIERDYAKYFWVIKASGSRITSTSWPTVDKQDRNTIDVSCLVNVKLVYRGHLQMMTFIRFYLWEQN
jgi:hypothetical protein